VNGLPAGLKLIRHARSPMTALPAAGRRTAAAAEPRPPAVGKPRPATAGEPADAEDEPGPSPDAVEPELSDSGEPRPSAAAH
jgi:hypothetical protein